MDPNVQVAIATVIGTAITTLGIVVVALINSRRGGDKDESEDKKDETAPDNNLKLIEALVMENARKESTIVRLTDRVSVLEAENAQLKAEKGSP